MVFLLQLSHLFPGFWNKVNNKSRARANYFRLVQPYMEMIDDARGVWGYASPEKCLKLGVLRSLNLLFFGQNVTIITYL